MADDVSEIDYMRALAEHRARRAAEAEKARARLMKRVEAEIARERDWKSKKGKRTPAPVGPNGRKLCRDCSAELPADASENLLNQRRCRPCGAASRRVSRQRTQERRDRSEVARKPKRWTDRNWPALVGKIIDRAEHRHLADVMLDAGLSRATWSKWVKKHPEFKAVTQRVAFDRRHWWSCCVWVQGWSVKRYRDLLREGVPKHKAADQAMAEWRELKEGRRVRGSGMNGAEAGPEYIPRLSFGDAMQQV